jgi:dephospho-CoA kinase
MKDQKLQILADKLIKEIPNISGAERLPNIYFVGKAGAGKSYSAKFMIKKYGYGVAKFAYPVYMIAEKYFGMINKDRKLLQVIGTDAGRDQIDSEIWVKRFKQDMTIIRLTAKILNRSIPKFVMDDCRFPNEHQVLKDLGFVGIYINVSDEKRKERLIGRDGTAQEKTLNHKSESLIDTFKDDLIKVDGNGSLEDSYKALNDLLQRLANGEKE